MDSAFKLSGALFFLFGLGYKLGKSDADEIKEQIDKALEFFETKGEKAMTLLKEFLESTESMSSDEIKANIEKFLSKATKKLDNIK
jgi:hypothetical protein